MIIPARFLLSLTYGAVLASHLGAQQAFSDSIAGMRPGRWIYHTATERKGQRQTIDDRIVTVADTIVAGAPAWLVTDGTSIGGQIVADSVAFTRDHRPLLRHAVFGKSSVTVEVAPGDSMVRGVIVVGASIVPLNVRLTPHGFLNYYALRASLPDFPLSGHWVGAAETLELGGEPRFTRLRLTVEGDERLTVDAGSFECWVVHVTGAGGVDERYWVDKRWHAIVRSREPVDNAGTVMELDLASTGAIAVATRSAGDSSHAADPFGWHRSSSRRRLRSREAPFSQP